MLDLISRRAPGQGPVHLLLISAAELGFAWDGNERGWVRPPLLRMMTRPIQQFFFSTLDAWRFRVFAKPFYVEGFGMDFFLVGPRRKMFPVSFVANKMEMVICFGNVLFHLYCMFGRSLSFLVLSLDRSKWTRCLLWHGWLPGLSCNVDRAPWAASFGQLAC